MWRDDGRVRVLCVFDTCVCVDKQQKYMGPVDGRGRETKMKIFFMCVYVVDVVCDSRWMRGSRVG